MIKGIETIVASSVWGVSVASLVLEWDVQGFTALLQLMVAISGAVYFVIIKIPHDFKHNRLNRKQTQLQNEVLRNEIEEYLEDENK